MLQGSIGGKYECLLRQRFERTKRTRRTERTGLGDEAPRVELGGGAQDGRAGSGYAQEGDVVSCD